MVVVVLVLVVLVVVVVLVLVVLLVVLVLVLLWLSLSLLWLWLWLSFCGCRCRCRCCRRGCCCCCCCMFCSFAASIFLLCLVLLQEYAKHSPKFGAFWRARAARNEDEIPFTVFLFDAGFSSFSSRLALEHIVAKDIFSSHPFTEFWREGLLSTRARKCQDCT